MIKIGDKVLVKSTKDGLWREEVYIGCDKFGYITECKESADRTYIRHWQHIKEIKDV